MIKVNATIVQKSQIITENSVSFKADKSFNNDEKKIQKRIINEYIKHQEMELKIQMLNKI